MRAKNWKVPSPCWKTAASRKHGNIQIGEKVTPIHNRLAHNDTGCFDPLVRIHADIHRVVPATDEFCQQLMTGAWLGQISIVCGKQSPGDGHS